MKPLGHRIAELTNLWLVGAALLVMGAMVGLLPFVVAAGLLSAFPDTFGPGVWSNVWFLLTAGLWFPVCVGVAARLLYGRVPDAIDRRRDPMGAGLDRC